MARIIFAGDFHPGQKSKVSEPSVSIYTDLMPVLESGDLNIVNLESPFWEGEGAILKSGPSLKSDPELVKLLSEGRFGVVTLANNHIMDYGTAGLVNTVNLCENNRIATVGAGMNLDAARAPLYRRIGDIKIGLLNFCENEFSTTHGDTPGANPLDPVSNFYDIKEVKQNCDVLFVAIHGGSEYYPLPTPRMQKTYRFFIDAGADAVVGHHPHVYSGYEEYKGKPIFYSLGNFVFNTPGKYACKGWYEGFLVEFSVSSGSVSFSTHPYMQFNGKSGVRSMNDREKEDFDNNINELNEKISNLALLNAEYRKFVKTKERFYLNSMEPYTGLLRSLHARHFLPSLISRKKRVAVLNTIRCEAHRDILIDSLTNSIIYEDRNTQ